MIFVDTSAWFALYVPEDADHTAARAFLTVNREPFLTTDYVIDELLTLLRSRDLSHRAMTVGESMLVKAACPIEWTKRADVESAWQVFSKFSDKQWSFTDCVSYAVMQRLGINIAFAFDQHFRQFGFCRVVP